MSRARFLLRQHAYDADRSLLFRPALILAALSFAAVFLPFAEERWPAWRAFGAKLTWAVPAEPSAVQVVLATIAGSVMTVVSIVYSVLIVALSLASVQFSPRIMAGFMRDRISQRILGLFIGTFTYCLLVLRSTHSEPSPFVPTLSVFGALLLAVACLGSLLFFVHHMAQAMQANFIVDRIAAETERVIDAVLSPQNKASKPAPPRPAETPQSAILSTASGYVQLWAAADLAQIASVHNVTLHVVRSMGHFVPEGGVLMVASGPLPENAQQTCRDALDLGPVRTMQDDLEFGLRQIVDIALKAISPAVNDPSTAVTCIDHLSRLLGRIARRGDASSTLFADDGRALVVFPPTGFQRAMDVAFHQIRQYGKGDVAVVLRLARALLDITSMTNHPEHRRTLAEHTRLLKTATLQIPTEDRAELDNRLALLAEQLQHTGAA
ncbi:MAG: DUF2254 domain-containing protein [Polyangiaceae bacterium]|nr:DUF2254 domain-containing protein [Polyangiaceae bacterium]